jgi:NAD(P)H-hydrate epimerase
MNRAGTRVAQLLIKDFPKANNIVILVGPGNNGGDGLVVAKQLFVYHQNRSSLNLTIVCPREGHSDLWKQKKAELIAAEGHRLQWISEAELVSFMKPSSHAQWDLLVDAAFGVGISRPLNSLWIQVLSQLRAQCQHSVAVDLPSGLDATTGHAYEGAPLCDRTYSMGRAKLGMVVGDGPRLCGRISCLAIGFSSLAEAELSPQIYFYGQQEALPDLPVADANSINKSTRGHLLVLAGSEGMEGAGALAATAAARMGAGYVTWARWPQPQGYMVPTPPSVLGAVLDPELEFLDRVKPPRAAVIGPGLGLSQQSRKLIKNIYNRFYDIPVVVDADALHLLKMEGLYPVPPQWILTPHSGELSKLLDVAIEDVNCHRLEILLTAQNKLGGTILLKGFRSLVSLPMGDVFVIGAGGPVLAKSGTGDVLAGMIGGLLSRGLEPGHALRLAAFLHGKAGDFYVKKWKNDFSLVASDMSDLLPRVLRGMYGSKI